VYHSTLGSTVTEKKREEKQDLVVEVDEGVGYPLKLPRQKILELLCSEIRD
jgi:hypothetical protein